jgi:hypothetical protein
VRSADPVVRSSNRFQTVQGLTSINQGLTSNLGITSTMGSNKSLINRGGRKSTKSKTQMQTTTESRKPRGGEIIEETTVTTTVEPVLLQVPLMTKIFN